MTIPRLELMAATVGARLCNNILKDLNINKHIEIFYWTDSSIVLNWLKNKGKLEVFVKNRINEILKLTDVKNWKHINGENNPADFPSRECSVKQLIQKKWWEGPEWLKKNPIEWPQTNMDLEEQITVVTVKSNGKDSDWFYKYFSNYRSILRLIACVIRFTQNCRIRKEERKSGMLIVTEIMHAEIILMRMIQDTYFGNKLDDLKSLNVFKDSNGLIRVFTRIFLREDNENFRTPIVLPDRHTVVKLLIKDVHENLNHAGVQITLNSIRENYWITNGRKAIRNELKKCIKCKRFTEKRVEVSPSLLPVDRIRNAKIFEVTGVDCAGPLYIKGRNKVYICIFTCAVYRAIHLELISDMSTTAFIQALRRFIGRRGRPSKIYCDNGTNFVGACNLLKTLHWEEVEHYSTIQKIEWRFNPPSAPWWGGWWERLIRIVKDLLKRVLGRACVTYEELLTIVCDCESIINGRPITYIMDNDPSVAPLTPSMFLQELNETGVADLDKVSNEKLNNRLKYVQKLHSDLRKRFRSEYLGFLIQKSKSSNPTDLLKIGEIVLVGSDNKKRLDWPLGKIIELLPGNDGKCRLVKLKTSKGELLRPVQRLYRLEVVGDCEEKVKASEERKINVEETLNYSSENRRDEKRKTSKFGRNINLPKRYLD